MTDVPKRWATRSVRSRYLGDEGMKDLGEFIAAIKEEIKNKTIRKIEVEEEKK